MKNNHFNPLFCVFIGFFPMATVLAEEATEIEADFLRRKDGVIYADGNVKIRRENITLCADQAQYDNAMQMFRATGSVKLRI